MTAGGVPTWVVGAGGLLGSHVVGSLRRRSAPVLTSRVPWSNPLGARAALSDGVARLREAADGRSWRVAWCAGTGVVATGAEAMAQERAVFRHVLAEIGARPALLGSGSLFLASSAGGVYAGSPGRPPFTEESPVGALVAYGRTKLGMEDDVAAFARATGTAVLVGRMANLYGPGQNLAKMQGLVSQLSRVHLSGQPLSIYVSLDTLRDYVYAADVGDLVVAGLDELAARTAGQSDRVVTKIVASGASVTVGSLIGESTRLHRSRPPVVVKAPTAGSGQIRDLRLRSIVWPSLDRHLRTPMVVGMARTAADVAQQLRAAH
jgi:UDP-glucose 4-epimerase